MANPSVANVVAASPVVTGGILRAPIGTALPTSTSVTLNAAFKALGFAGDGGLTNTLTRSTDLPKAWGGAPVGAVQTDYAEVFTFTFLETLNPEVNKAVWGDANVTVTAASSTVGTLQAIQHNSAPLPYKAWVLDMFLGATGTRRIAVPFGSLALSGDVNYVTSALVSYPVTLTALTDASGNTSYEYINDGITT